jgi:hypothetical protein
MTQYTEHIVGVMKLVIIWHFSKIAFDRLSNLIFNNIVICFNCWNILYTSLF